MLLKAISLINFLLNVKLCQISSVSNKYHNKKFTHIDLLINLRKMIYVYFQKNVLCFSNNFDLKNKYFCNLL